MKRTFSIACAAALFAASTTFALSAEPIEGTWKTQSGENAKISKCGSSFCIKLTTGQYTGKQIGKLKGSGAEYKGTVTDPEDDREYSGNAKVSGKSMKLQGCALRVFCQTQTWKKL
ncbi:MAG: DUF2147 domain-containing protein [Pseudomonadota bacterium]